jgi:peptidoglycan/LPS O-acetylase OafA/YrhL
LLDFLALLGAYPVRGGGAAISLNRVLLVGMPAIIVVSALLYYLIEKPFQASRKPSSHPRPWSWRPRHPIAILSLWAAAQLAFLAAVS